MDGPAARQGLLLFSVPSVRDSGAVERAVRREERFYFGRGCRALDCQRLPVMLVPANLGLRCTLLGCQRKHSSQKQPAQHTPALSPLQHAPCEMLSSRW